jgi:hypothetical protein
MVDFVECRRCMFAWQYPRRRTTEKSVGFFDQAHDDVAARRPVG